jgi:Concanavalin A-like lectin/glucanases superfamily
MKNVISLKISNILRIVIIISFFQTQMMGQTKALKFEFDLSTYPESTGKNTVKEQLQEAGRILGSFIDMDNTVYIKVTQGVCNASATGGPDFNATDYYYINDTTISKFIVKRGTMTLCTSGVADMEYKSQINTFVHELIHALGVTKNVRVFEKMITDSTFSGSNTKRMNGGQNAILQFKSSSGKTDLSHFMYKEDKDFPLSITPAIRAGGGNIISALDLAILADLGYNIPILKDKTKSFFIDMTMDSKLNGTVSWDLDSLNQSYLVSGLGGNDVITNNGLSDLIKNGTQTRIGGKINKKIIVLEGQGGDDILIAGTDTTQMYGDYRDFLIVDTSAGTGKDIFYIKNTMQHRIASLQDKDKIYFDPSLNITNDNLNNLTVKFLKNNSPYREFEVAIGTLKLTLQLKNIRNTETEKVKTLVKNCITLICPDALAKIIGVSTATTQSSATTTPTIGKVFNGTSDVVTTNFTPSRSGITGITIEYWFKGTKIQSAFRLQNGEKFIVAGWRETDPVHFFSNEGPNKLLDIKTKAGGSVQDNQWHHIAVTWSRGTKDGFKSYVDGELVHQRDASNAPIPDFVGKTADLGAFVDDGNKSEFTKGELARVRVWKVARTPEQIKESKDRATDYAADANLLYQGTPQ